MMANLLTPPPPALYEHVDVLYATPHCRIERICSTGQTSPEGFWYDQDEDEWLTVLAGVGEVTFADGEAATLNAGDTLSIPAGRRHRVSYTSSVPPCIWLCVFCQPATQ